MAEGGQAPVLISEERIRTRVAELGAAISRDFAGKPVHLLGVLKGSFIFMADLARAIKLPLTIDFIGLSSYGHLTQSTGVVKITLDLTVPLHGRHVLIVEDIIDTGLTMSYLIDNLKTREPASVAVCALVRKPHNEKVQVDVAYCGFEVPDRFIVGYGLDAAERHRNLPYIGLLEGVDG